MTRQLLGAIALCAAALALTGCAASGPKYAEMSNTMSTLKSDEGRIFFLRSNRMLGAAIQPDIRLDGQVVGKSQPGGFFFVDRAAGNHSASTTTEVERSVSFNLEAGETKYLRTSASLGVVMGRVVVRLETPEKARSELPALSYIGSVSPKTR